MTADQLPINQTVVVAQSDDLRTSATRVDNDWVFFTYHDQRTNDETLKVRARVDGASSELVHFDKLYWSVTINGRPATEGDLLDLATKSGLSISVNASGRAIAVTVR